MKEQKVVVDGLTINTQVYGEQGPAVICLHGWLDLLYQPFLESLSKECRVIFISCPGYNHSQESQILLSMDSLSHLIDAVVKAYQLDGFYLLGFSMGTHIVGHYALTHNFKDKIVLIGAPLQPFKLGLKRLLLQPPVISLVRQNAALKEWAVDQGVYFASGLSSSEKTKGQPLTFEDYTLNGAFDTLIALITDHIDFKPLYNQTLFIYGENDSLLKQAQAESLSPKIIEKGSHNLFKDYGDVVSRLVLQYLLQ